MSLVKSLSPKKPTILENEFLRDFHDNHLTEDSFNEKEPTEEEIREAIEEMEQELADEPDNFFDAETELETKTDFEENPAETLSDDLAEVIQAEKAEKESKFPQTVKSGKTQKAKGKAKAKTLKLAA